MKVIKNVSRIDVNTIFRGRKISLPHKHSMTLDENNEEERALYYYLTSTFGFVIDISQRFAEMG